MLKNVVIDTNSPVAEAMRIGIAQLIAQQEAKEKEARTKLETVYNRLRQLDKERESVELQVAALVDELDKAKATISYLGNQATAIESVLREE